VELYKCESDVGKKRVLLDSREEKENSYMGVKKRLKNSKIGFIQWNPASITTPLKIPRL